ncbi:putative immunity/bacteriocin fusion bifunctional protein [Cerasibacillus sp. JNUCC 74]
MAFLTKKMFNSSSVKVLLLLSLVFMFFSSPATAFASIEKEDGNCNRSDGIEEDVNYIDGEEKMDVLNSLETNNVFTNSVPHDYIDPDKSKVINLGENDYADGDVLQVTSLYEHSTDEINHDLLTVFVEKDSGKVLKISYFEIDSEKVDYKDFDETGKLMIHKESSYNDFINGNLDNGKTHYSDDDNKISAKKSGPKGFWQKFACGFSGNVACMAGCVASFAAPGIGGALFTACTAACTTVWGAGLC